MFFYLFVRSLFSHAVSNSNRVPLEDRMIMNDELEKIEKRGIVSNLRYQHLPRGAEENQERLQLESCVLCPRFETETSRI
jgi:hypothetical protein